MPCDFTRCYIYFIRFWLATLQCFMFCTCERICFTICSGGVYFLCRVKSYIVNVGTYHRVCVLLFRFGCLYCILRCQNLCFAWMLCIFLAEFAFSLMLSHLSLSLPALRFSQSSYHSCFRVFITRHARFCIFWFCLLVSFELCV